MKKRSNSGFILLETLIATVFISGALIFFFSQFNSLNRKYDISYKYNSVQDIYLLNVVSNFILDDNNFYQENLDNLDDYLEISDCSMLSNIPCCKKLFDKANIDILLVTTNKFDKTIFSDYDDDIKDFIDKISPIGNEKYRLIAKFKDGKYATVKFGDKYE